MASYEEWLKKMRKKDKEVVKKWNANNTNKITTDNLTPAPSQKEQEKERKRLLAEQKKKKEEAERKKKEEEERKKRERLAEQKRRREHLKTQNEKRTNRHKMTKDAKEYQNKAMNTYAYPRAILGALEGGLNATTGLSSEGQGVTEETKNSMAYRAGKLAGQIGTYAAGYGSAGGLTAKAAGKALTTGAGKAMTTKLAKSKLVKSAAKKTLKKQGQNATEKAVEHMARKNAKKLAEGLTKNAIADMTVGTALDSNIARSKGYEVGSDEWNKEMAINAALNLGVGGAVEIAPTVAKALSNTKVAQKTTDTVLRASNKLDVKASEVGDKVKAKLPQKKVKAPAVKEETKASLPSSVDDAVEVVAKNTGNPVKAEAPQKTARQQAYDDAVRQYEELMAKEAASHAETIKSYKKQGVNVDFTPDRERLDAGWEASDGFGFSTRSSANEQWYQDFYKQNGRQPNKSEAEAIAREHIENDLFTARNNPASAGDAELGASAELKDLERKISQMEWEDEALNSYKTEPADTDWTIESGELMNDLEFQKALDKQYRTPEAIEAAAEESGLSKNDWLRMKYDEFYQFGKVDSMDAATQHPTVGGFEVEGDTSLGIISPDFRAMEEMFDRVRTKGEKFRKQFVTGQQEIERMAKVSGSDRTLGYVQGVRNSQGTMSHIFNEKLVDSAGKVLDDMSYKKLIKQIPEKDLADFNKYAQHLHNIDRIAVDPEKAVYRQTSSEESQKIVEELLAKHPEFKTYSENITKWWNKFTKAWLVDTGRMTPAAYDAMIAKYPNYIPTYRVDKSNSIGGLANRINAGKAVRGAVGGTSEVKPLQDGFLQEMERIVSSTRKNDLYATVIDELRKNPEQLKQFGVAVDDAPAVLGDDVGDFLTQIEEQGLKQVHDKVAQVTAYVDGKPQSAYINMEMLDALKLLNNTIDSKNVSMLVNAGRAITNPVKAGITGLNPLFALANAMRDLPTLYIQSQNGVWETTSNIGKAIKEIVTKGEKYDLYKALGGKHSGYFAQGKGFKDIKDYTSNPLRKAWRGVEGALSALGETTETIPRLAEFISTLEKTGGDKDGALKALYDAGEVTVNFSRSAPATKILDAWTLYLNAAVQGLDKFARTVKAHPVRTGLRSASVITVPYAALMIANRDNPHYQNLNERTKQNYFCIPYLAGEKDADGNAMTFIKIPLNREYGALFGSLLDVADGYRRGEENPWEGMGETIGSNFLPPNPLTDNVLAPLAIDLPHNEDFAGRKIVPTNLLKASPGNQYDANTSGVALGVAKFANNLSERLPGAKALIPEALKSPKKVDFLIDSYGGYLGSVAQSATAQGAETPKEVLRENILQGTIIDPFKDRFTADSRYSSGVLEDFYNEMAEIETGKVDEGLEDSKGVNYTKYRVYTEISEQLTELSKQEKEILSNSKLSKEQKEKQISSLRQQKNKLARSAKTQAAQAEQEYKQAPEFAVLATDVKEKWQGSGVSKQEFAKAYNARQTKDGAKKGLANAMEMYSAGVQYKAASAVDSSVSENTWSAAKRLADNGITPSQVQEIAKQIDRNGNGSYAKEEITDYLNGSNYSQSQKRYLFDAFATWRNAQNPY